jgi:hypothetical protein
VGGNSRALLCALWGRILQGTIWKQIHKMTGVDPYVCMKEGEEDGGEALTARRPLRRRARLQQGRDQAPEGQARRVLPQARQLYRKTTTREERARPPPIMGVLIICKP